MAAAVGARALQQSGECRIAAPRAAVWQALNDPAVLERCIEGCEGMQRSGEAQFIATVRTKIGPVSASFTGEVTLADLVPPTSYRIIGSGTGGAAGFARGEARVTLHEVDGGTLLEYALDAKVGGKLAQIGSRLVDGAARKMADDFFARLRGVLEAQHASAPEAQRDIGPEAQQAMGPEAQQDIGVQHGLALAVADGAAMDDGVAAPGNGTPVEPVASQQWIIWSVVFGVLALALILAAL